MDLRKQKRQYGKNDREEELTFLFESKYIISDIIQATVEDNGQTNDQKLENISQEIENYKLYLDSLSDEEIHFLYEAEKEKQIQHWAHRDALSVSQCIALLMKIYTKQGVYLLPKNNNIHTLRTYNDFNEIITSSLNLGSLLSYQNSKGDVMIPMEDFVNWANKKGFELPEKLTKRGQSLVVIHSSNPSPENLEAENKRLQEELEQAKQKVKMVTEKNRGLQRSLGEVQSMLFSTYLGITFEKKGLKEPPSRSDFLKAVGDIEADDLLKRIKAGGDEKTIKTVNSHLEKFLKNPLDKNDVCSVCGR